MIPQPLIDWRSITLYGALPMYVGVLMMPRSKRGNDTSRSLLLLGLEVFIVLSNGAWRYLSDARGFHPGFWVLSVLLGHALYVQCLLMTRLSAREAIRYGFCLPYLVKFYRRRPGVFGHYLWVSLREELVWRVGIQQVFGNTTMGLLGTATLFTLTHSRRPDGGPTPWALFELWIFGLWLGWLFNESHSLLLVVGIHTVRNVHLTFYYQARWKASRPRERG